MSSSCQNKPFYQIGFAFRISECFLKSGSASRKSSRKVRKSFLKKKHFPKCIFHTLKAALRSLLQNFCLLVLSKKALLSTMWNSFLLLCSWWATFLPRAIPAMSGSSNSTWALDLFQQAWPPPLSIIALIYLWILWFCVRWDLYQTRLLIYQHGGPLSRISVTQDLLALLKSLGVTRCCSFLTSMWKGKIVDERSLKRMRSLARRSSCWQSSESCRWNREAKFE